MYPDTASGALRMAGPETTLVWKLARFKSDTIIITQVNFFVTNEVFDPMIRGTNVHAFLGFIASTIPYKYPFQRGNIISDHDSWGAD